MRPLLLAALLLAIALPAAALAAPDGKVAVTRNGELDGFTQDGKLHRLHSLRAFLKYTKQGKNKAIFKKCGLDRALFEDLKGPPGTDGISGATHFNTDRGALSCARRSSKGPGEKVAGLPHSKLFLLGEGDHPGRNLRFVVGATAYTVAFSPTASFDPGNSGLITAAKALYARVK